MYIYIYIYIQICTYPDYEGDVSRSAGSASEPKLLDRAEAHISVPGRSGRLAMKAYVDFLSCALNS